MVEPHITRARAWQTDTFCGFVIDVAGYELDGVDLPLHDCAVADEAVLPQGGGVSFLVVCFHPMAEEQVATKLLRAIKVAGKTADG